MFYDSEKKHQQCSIQHINTSMNEWFTNSISVN